MGASRRCIAIRSGCYVPTPISPYPQPHMLSVYLDAQPLPNCDELALIYSQFFYLIHRHTNAVFQKLVTSSSLISYAVATHHETGRASANVIETTPCPSWKCASCFPALKTSLSTPLPRSPARSGILPLAAPSLTFSPSWSHSDVLWCRGAHHLQPPLQGRAWSHSIHVAAQTSHTSPLASARTAAGIFPSFSFVLFCSDSTQCLWVCLSFHNGKDLVRLGHIARWAWFRFSVQMVAWFISVVLSVHNMEGKSATGR